MTTVAIASRGVAARLRGLATPLAVTAALTRAAPRWQSSAPAFAGAGGGGAGGAPGGGAGAASAGAGARGGLHPPPAAPAPGAPAPAPAPAASPFLDASLVLSRREAQVFRRPAPPAPAPPPAEHGLLYGFTEADLAAAGAPPSVARALSTRTAGAAQARRFRKAQLVARLGGGGGADTGCARVQVGMMTDSLARLAAHSAAHRHDKAVKRTLQILASRRAKLLGHMQRTDYESYRATLRELGLRPVPVVPARHPPKARAETHAQINARNARLKRRAGRGDRGH